MQIYLCKCKNKGVDVVEPVLVLIFKLRNREFKQGGWLNCETFFIKYKEYLHRYFLKRKRSSIYDYCKEKLSKIKSYI